MFTTREKQILMGMNLNPLTGDEYALKKHMDDLGKSGVLPAVTADDNGDVLTVVEGAWAKADAPSGLPAVSGSDNGKVLKVANGAWSAEENKLTVTITESSGTYSADKTLAEIIAADAAGKTIEAVMNSSEFSTGLRLVLGLVQSATPMVAFAATYYNALLNRSQIVTLVGSKYQSADVWTVIRSVVPNEGLPDVTGSDNGKALLVSNGAWAAGALPKDTYYPQFTVDITNNSATTTSTYAEIMAAKSAGKFVAAEADMGGGLTGIFPMGLITGSTSLAFWGIIPVGGTSLGYMTLTVANDDSVTPNIILLQPGQ